MYFILCVLSHFSRVRLFAILWTIAHQAPLSRGYPGKNTGPPSGDRPDPGIEPMSLTCPALAGSFFTTSAIWGGLYFTWWTTWFWEGIHRQTGSAYGIHDRKAEAPWNLAPLAPQEVLLCSVVSFFPLFQKHSTGLAQRLCSGCSFCLPLPTSSSFSWDMPLFIHHLFREAFTKPQIPSPQSSCNIAACVFLHNLHHYQK